MKKALFLALILVCARPLFSQELTIVKKDGSVLRFDPAQVDSITFSNGIQQAAGNDSDWIMTSDLHATDTGSGASDGAEEGSGTAGTETVRTGPDEAESGGNKNHGG